MAKKKTGPKLYYTFEQVANALTKTFGIKLAAAKRLGCHRVTVDEYIARWPELEDVRQQAKEGRVDLAEAKLIELTSDNHFAATRFTLEGSKEGRARGWGTRPQIQIGDQDNRQLQITIEKLMIATGAETESGVLSGLAGLLDGGDVVEGEVVGDE